MTNPKKVKGSALYLEDGSYIFTPYKSAPEKSPWKKMVATANGKLRSTDDVINLSISVKKTPKSYSVLMAQFSELMVKINEVL